MSDWEPPSDEDLSARPWYTPAIPFIPRILGIGALLVAGIVVLVWFAPPSDDSSGPKTAETAMAAQTIDLKADAAATDAAASARSIPEAASSGKSVPENGDQSSPGPRTEERAETFDCSRAVMPLDWAICADPQALSQNTDMVTVWHAVRNSLPVSERKAYVDRHMKWILSTQASCGLPVKGHPSNIALDSAAACVRKAYAERILAIQRERDIQLK